MNRRPSHDMDERISLHVLHRGLLLQKTQEPGMSLSRRQWDRHLRPYSQMQGGLERFVVGRSHHLFRRGGDGVVHRDFDSPRPYTQVDSSIWASANFEPVVGQRKELFVPYCRILRTAFLGVVGCISDSSQRSVTARLRKSSRTCGCMSQKHPLLHHHRFLPLGERSTHLSQDRQGPILVSQWKRAPKNPPCIR